MAVKAGQVLARLDDTTLRRYLELSEAELSASRRVAAETEVRLKEAGQTLDRARALVRDGIAGQAELDRAEAEVDALKARLALTREQVTVAERQVALRQADLDDTVDSCAVFRRRALEGRSARRNGLAGFRRRRVHAHGHLDDCRHVVARDRSGREREFHSTASHPDRGSRRRSMRTRTGRIRAASSRSCPPPIVSGPPCWSESASRSSTRGSCRTWREGAFLGAPEPASSAPARPRLTVPVPPSARTRAVRLSSWWWRIASSAVRCGRATPRATWLRSPAGSRPGIVWSLKGRPISRRAQGHRQVTGERV